MALNTELLIELTKLAIAGIITYTVMRMLDRRSKLISYYGHIAAHRLNGEQPIEYGTHTIIIRNSGRQPAHNVKVSHNVLPPNIDVHPKMEYNYERVPNSADNLVFPILCPGQQVTISYLYELPLNYSQITTGVRSDEGMAKVIPVITTRQYKRWQLQIISALMIIGALTVVYGASLLALYLYSLLN